MDNSTISALTTNKEISYLDGPQDEVWVEKPKDKHRGRVLKGQEDGTDPDTILLKDLKLYKKLTKK